MEGIATLISYSIVKDAIGQYVNSQAIRTDIYITEKSVTRAEFFEAGRAGLNSSLVLVTPKVNYSGEKEIEYNGEKYGIYRTFTNGDDIELYLERKAGV